MLTRSQSSLFAARNSFLKDKLHLHLSSNGWYEENHSPLPYQTGNLSYYFAARRKRSLYCIAKSNHRSVIRPPVAIATFHKRSYERAVLLRQRAARLVLAFAICKSRRARAREHYGTAILAFPLFFFTDSHLVVLRNSILESCRVGKKGAGREKEAIDGEKKRRTWRDVRRKAEG